MTISYCCIECKKPIAEMCMECIHDCDHFIFSRPGWTYDDDRCGCGARRESHVVECQAHCLCQGEVCLGHAIVLRSSRPNAEAT
jgi:hypothetical protein